MVQVRRSTVIDAPIDAVWGMLRDFNGHERWHPDYPVMSSPRRLVSVAWAVPLVGLALAGLSPVFGLLRPELASCPSGLGVLASERLLKRHARVPIGAVARVGDLSLCGGALPPCEMQPWAQATGSADRRPRCQHQSSRGLLGDRA